MAKKMSKGARAALLKSLQVNKPVAPVKQTASNPTAKPVTITPKKPVTITPKKTVAKPAAKVIAKKTVAKPTGDHWFAKLDKKQQAAYIKAHPRSKYAKQAAGKTVAAKPVKPATTAKLDAVRKELAELQKKKASMSPEAYSIRLKTIRAKIANIAGTAKPRVAAKKPAAKKPVAKSKLHLRALDASAKHASVKKKIKSDLAKVNANLLKLKGRTTPAALRKIEELKAQKSKLRAAHAKEHVKHTVVKSRVKAHTDKLKAKKA